MLRPVPFIAVIAALVLSGCSPADSQPAVKTVAVTGKVLDTGGKPVTGGMLSLRSITNAEQLASAKVNDDGQFTLTSLVGEKRVDGAQPGEYSVLYAPDSEDQTASQNSLPVTLKKTYVIEAGQTELEIKLE